MQDVRAMMLRSWAERLDNTIRRGGLGRFSTLPVIETISGPRVGALAIQMGLDTGRLLAVLSGNDAALARQFVPWEFPGTPQVFMAGRAVRMEVGWPDDQAERDIRLADISAHPRGGGRWIAGKTDTGTTVTLGINGSTSPHFLIAGQTGSGKTLAMRSAVAQLSRDPSNRIILVDGKLGQGLAPVAAIRGRVGPLATDVTMTRAALGWAVGEMVRRFRDGAVPTRRVVVVIDEIQEWTGRNGDPVITELVRKLVTQGREAGVHCIIGTQHPTMEALSDSSIRANLPGRIALRTDSYKASEVAVGAPSPRADRLLGSGDSYAITPTGAARVQIAYIPQHDLESFLGGEVEFPEWPEYNAESLGMGQEEGPSGAAFAAGELAVSLVQARLGSGRPALVRALAAAGLGTPGSQRAARLLKLGRDVLTALQDDSWDITPADGDGAACLPTPGDIPPEG